MPCRSRPWLAHSLPRSSRETRARRKNGARVAPASFAARGAMRQALLLAAKKLRQALAARNRVLDRRARDDQREWVVKRRERTRQLIELGGLIAKAGIVELTGDDRT